MGWKTYTNREREPMTVAQYMRNHFHISARDGQILFRKKRVKVNGRVAHSKRIVKEGDRITWQPLQDTSYGVTVEEGPVDVLYEDNYTLVVNKPPYMVVHPTGQTMTHTLSNYIAGYYHAKGELHTIRPVHRLDRDTSGCIVFAKTKEAQRYYTEQLEQGGIHRVYRALVRGCMSGSDTICAPIGIDPLHPNRRIVVADGQEAITHYTVLFHDDEQSELELTLSTGRTHQIRVHLAHIGHPVLGDGMYGKRDSSYTRQSLHAAALHFQPFLKDAPLVVVAPMPADFGKEKRV